MRIHREGYRPLLIALLLLVVLNMVFIPVHHGRGWLFYGLLALSTLFYLFVVHFFRRPVRPLKPDQKILFSPADGTVVAIEKVMEDQYFKQSRIQISIFMSPLNIHANFCALSGTVKMVHHKPGRYWVAWHPKSSEENERTTTVIEHETGEAVMIRQIAGAVARRIVTYVKAGDAVQQGQELGFIKFGSRVDIFLPPGSPVKVALDQKVKANKTIIGLLP
jgi:phosphatidylserine decarboxylase